ncbi:MAG: pilus assembly protein [Nitrosomonadales bacterium]|jgi:Flp pilus assembly protein TadG|nr:MAG: pilus assembly protein [Nitrosomonadales bacterium]
MIVKNIQITRKKARGAVAVEMALLMIPLIVMGFGAAEFGRAIYEYNTLTKSVRDGVRHVSQSSPTDTLKAEAIRLTVYGTTNASLQPLLPNLNEGMVVITEANDTTTGINMVTVTITGYTFNFVFNPLVFFGNTATSITFDDIHATMRQ